MSPWSPDLHERAANTIRALAIDATNAARSGHPGAPMGLADLATILWGEVMRFDPEDPEWLARDRFVLSNGHASMLLYAALHLTGHRVSLEDLKRFRQLHSPTAGHPEFGQCPGVETTTGPLGQGFANAVGMALGCRLHQARMRDADGPLIDPRVFVIAGDGCLMEGVTYEAASLAGHLQLGALNVFFDDNGITIDGRVDLSFSEDVAARFQACRWQVLRADGHDPDSIRHAIASLDPERPTLIQTRTHIGYGSPNRQDTAKAHGEPMGDEEGAAAKEALGWDHPPFHVPEDVREAFRAAGRRGTEAHRAWSEQLARRLEANPALAERYRAHHRAPDGWTDAELASMVAQVGSNKDATRGLSGRALNAIASVDPRLVGGSADLTGSNKSSIADSSIVRGGEFEGRNIHFGIREHAMGAVVNGLSLFGGFVPFGATFLVFSDYMRPPIRLSALMQNRSLTVFTHDSIGLGEDGPTHQPVEHLWSLRLTPGLSVWRPADGLECAMAWAYATREGPNAPHAMVFTRQKVAPIARPEGFDPRTVWQGGYVVRPGTEAVLVATGSEVELALGAAEALEADGISLRVVSMPCLERFFAQPESVQNEVLGGLPIATVEAGRTDPWAILTGPTGLRLGVDRFGESAPYQDLYTHFGLTVEAIGKEVKAWLQRG
jgi:transketolase